MDQEKSTNIVIVALIVLFGAIIFFLIQYRPYDTGLELYFEKYYNGSIVQVTGGNGYSFVFSIRNQDRDSKFITYNARMISAKSTYLIDSKTIFMPANSEKKVALTLYHANLVPGNRIEVELIETKQKIIARL